MRTEYMTTTILALTRHLFNTDWHGTTVTLHVRSDEHGWTVWVAVHGFTLTGTAATLDAALEHLLARLTERVHRHMEDAHHLIDTITTTAQE